MLKPRKKITIKEIKRDPLLETTYKVQSYIAENRPVLLRALGVVVVVVVAAILLIGRFSTANREAQTAIGKALVAYSQGDLDNARFQFEYVNDQYGKTDQGTLAVYYLGKIKFDQGQLAEARKNLETFVKASKVDLLTSNAYSILADIYHQEGNLEQAITKMKAAVKFAGTKSDQFNKQLLLAGLISEQGQLEEAQRIITKILAEEALPTGVKRQAEEMSGKLQMLADRR
ncbi:MAG: tetratricopeptide repeat protein [Candidatus Neomarinimicrobiota bacterium]